MHNNRFPKKSSQNKHPSKPQLDPDLHDWSPGSVPAPKFNMPKPKSGHELVLRKIESALVNCFLHENPPADDVAVVRDSLQEVDANQKLWKAKVMTTIALPKSGLKQHISVVRFRIVCTPDRKGNPAKDTYSIHHNYVIFPS